MNKKLQKLSEKARNLTHSPGVYLMKDKKGTVIYIGKAKVLKNRVSQYFQPNNPSHTEKVKRMVEQVADFDYIVVDSEFEALVLECSLIKQNNPKYNILLKDDKGYHYIRISKENFPRITATKQISQDEGNYLGPYTSSYSVSQTVDEVNKIFKLPTCSRKFPQEFGKSRPCLNFYIKQCMGLCKGKISNEEYNEIVSQAISYIKKGSKNLIGHLQNQMQLASENMEFEKAANLRDRIRAIQKISETQKVYLVNTKNQDIIAFAQNMSKACVVILKFRNYKLSDKEEHLFLDIDDLKTLRQEFLDQYYIENVDIPPNIIVDEEFEGRELLQEYLSSQLQKKVNIAVPIKGEHKKMIDMAFKNASEKLSKQVERTGREVAALDELTKLLGLSKTPQYIEAYDISNLGESGKVGGMVVFENGRPLKSAYKKFKINDVEGQDDYSSMKEIITRRFRHYLQEKNTGKGFGKLPDLILLDGGKGHVAAILPILAEMGLNIPTFGMVKDSRHRTRAIAKNGGEIAISGFRAAFSFITHIQDEVHRYSVNYQRTVRNKSALEITLTHVKGIGPKKAAAVLKAFKTKKELKSATSHQLRQIAKINEETAQKLYNMIQEL